MFQQAGASIVPPPHHSTSQPSQSMLPEPTRITQLPVELIVEILNLCECQDVASVCKSSRFMYEVAVPVLYSTVNLSSHNVKSRSDERVHFIGQDLEPHDLVASGKQRCFIRTIAEVPKYGEYVRELHWTVLGAYSDTKYPYNQDADKASDSKLERNDDMLWDTFQKLANVALLDICWLREWRELSPAPRMFAKAKAVLLSGCMSQEFTACLLESCHQSLETFESSNVQRWSDIIPPPPKFNHIQELQGQIRAHSDLDRGDVGDSDYYDTPAPRIMPSLLEPFHEDVHLTSLHIGLIGNDFSRGHGGTNPHPFFDVVYASWGKTLAAMKDTLKRFSFNQDTRTDRFCVIPRPPPVRMRDVDRLFNKWILPVLLESEWPQLRSVELRGIQEVIHDGRVVWVNPDEYDEERYLEFQAMREDLAKNFPECTHFVLEEFPAREYSLLYGEDDGVPM